MTITDDVPLSNRESWLTALAKEVEPMLRSRTSLGTKPYRIACGWPSRKGTSHAHRRIGECWSGMDHGVAEMFISPTLDDPAEIAHVVVHEMLHAFLPPGVGHRKPFSQAAKKVGLVGKPTATVAGDQLAVELKAITDRLGPYPHDKIDVGGPKERGRNLKYQCAGCGYIGRSSAYWLDNFGPPICIQCGVQMIQGDDIEVEDPLVIISNMTEFRIPGDERFRIMRTLSGKVATWKLIDYQPEAPIKACLLSTQQEYEVLQLGAAPVPARVTPAESRQDALDIIEGLRTGLTTYNDLAENLDENVEDMDEDYLDEDEDEALDYDDSDIDPRFRHEVERGVRIEDIDPEFEAARRENLKEAA